MKRKAAIKDAARKEDSSFKSLYDTALELKGKAEYETVDNS